MAYVSTGWSLQLAVNTPNRLVLNVRFILAESRSKPLMNAPFSGSVLVRIITRARGEDTPDLPATLFSTRYLRANLSFICILSSGHVSSSSGPTCTRSGTSGGRACHHLAGRLPSRYRGQRLRGATYNKQAAADAWTTARPESDFAGPGRVSSSSLRFLSRQIRIARRWRC